MTFRLLQKYSPNNARNKVSLADTVEAALLQHGQPAEDVTKRVARIDNVKGLCSSEELEAILTSPVINAYRFMKGDASRQNNITFILTGNALHLSTDIARRTFTINLTSPGESESWREELMTYIRTNRKKIFSDIIAEMRKPKEKIDYGIGSDGWAGWCILVLSHVRNPKD